MDAQTAQAVFAGLAFVVSCFALGHSIHTSRRLAKLTEPQARLAEAKHKDLVREQQRSMTADVRAELRNIRYEAYSLSIENFGPAIARQVRMQVVDTALKDNFDLDQVTATLPIQELRVGEPAQLSVHRYVNQRYSELKLILTWNDDSGVDRQRQVSVQFH